MFQHQDKAGYYLKKTFWEKKRNTDYFQADQHEQKGEMAPNTHLERITKLNYKWDRPTKRISMFTMKQAK